MRLHYYCTFEKNQTYEVFDNNYLNKIQKIWRLKDERNDNNRKN